MEPMLHLCSLIPLDWYAARQPLIAEHETEKANDKIDQPSFGQWWDQVGRQEFTQLINRVKRLKPAEVVRSLLIGHPTELLLMNLDEDLAGLNSRKSYEEFVLIMDNINEAVKDVFAVSTTVGSVLPALTDSEGKEILNEIRSLKREVEIFISNVRHQTLLTTKPSDRVRPVRKYHLVDHKTIIHNSIRVNDKILNAVKVGDDIYCINDFIPPHHRKLLDANGDIIDPDNNVRGAKNDSIRVSYAQSFLREEVGKMYGGELVLRGIPEIEPWDVILLTDAATGMVGPIEVESVIHSFNQETGYITIVKPRALLLINETATVTSLSSLLIGFKNARAKIDSLETTLKKNVDLTVTGVVGSTVLAGAAIAAVSIFGAPAAIVLGALGLTGFFTIIGATTKLQLAVVIPLARFGRAWLGGLEGYRVGDMAELLEEKWQQFKIDEIYPTIEGARLIGQVLAPSLSKVLPSIDTATSISSIGQITPTLNTPTDQIRPRPVPITGSDAISRWAEAIRKHEGGRIGDRNTRNNNPGNLKVDGDAIPPRDADRFGRFTTPEKGLEALKKDSSCQG
jgi:hypothetical protein